MFVSDPRPDVKTPACMARCEERTKGWWMPPSTPSQH
jgi:hypothetical protein